MRSSFLLLFAFSAFMSSSQSLQWFQPLDLDVPYNGVFPSLSMASQDDGDVAVFGPTGPVISWSGQRFGDLGWQVYDATGTSIGSSVFPATAGICDLIASNGSWIAVGRYKDSLQFPGHPLLSAGQLDPIGSFICRLGTDGTVAWVVDASDLGLSGMQAVDEGPNGELFVAAWDFQNSAVAKLDANGAILDTWPLSGVGIVSDIAVNNAGTVAIAGSCLDTQVDLHGTPVSVAATYTIYTARFAPDDTLIDHLIVEDVTCPMPEVELDDAGNAYFSADASIPSQVGPFTLTDPAWVYGEFLVRLDASGAVTWLDQPVPGNTLGDAARASGKDLLSHPDGGVWQGGLMRGEIDWGSGIVTSSPIPGQKLYFRHVDEAGTSQWVETSGSSTFGQTVHSLATDGDALYMLGYAYDTLQLGGLTFSEQGYHLFLTRWDVVANGLPDDAERQSLRVFPNPADDRVVLDCTGLTAPVELVLMDALGQLVHGERVLANGPLTLDVGNLPAGTYFLHVKDGALPRHTCLVVH